MSPRTLTVLLLASALSTAACVPSNGPPGTDASSPGADASSPGADGGAMTEAPPATIGPAARPARLIVPPAHDGTTALPLVFLLHGYSGNSRVQDAYWRAAATAREMGFYLVLPEGTTDFGGKQFWNATPACCDFGATGVDDVGYLTSLLDAAEAALPVDRSRVYFIGHSNGSFMSFRMACELSERIAAIGGLAGADFLGDDDCVPEQPVSVLHVHGTADATIPYAGTALYPGARAAVLRWAERAGCDPTREPEALAPLDLDTSLAGAETRVERWSTGCEPGFAAELWTIEGGSHIPAFGAAWMPELAGWLLRHRRE